MNEMAEAVYHWTTESWSARAEVTGDFHRGEQAVPEVIKPPYAVLNFEPEQGERDSGADMDYVHASLTVFSRTPDEAVRLVNLWLSEIEQASIEPVGGSTVGIETMGPPDAVQEERYLWRSTGITRFQTQFNR